MNNAEKINLSPIGYVKNTINTRQELLSQNPAGIKSSLIIYDKYLEGLYRIEECSHIVVCCYLNKATKQSLTAQHKKFGIPSEKRGIFSSRSPSRPNNLAITTTKLLEVRNGNELIVERFDMFDNTPIIDIKSYSEGLDLVFNTASLNKKMDYSKAPNQELYLYFRDLILNYVYAADESIDLGLFSIIKILKTLNKIPDRTIVENIETDYTSTALDVVCYFSKYTNGESKIKTTQTNNSNNSYIKLTLKTGEIWELSNKNLSTKIDLDLLTLNRVN